MAPHLPGLVWDEARQRYFKAQPAHIARGLDPSRPELVRNPRGRGRGQPPPEAPPTPSAPPSCATLLRLRELGLAQSRARAAAPFARTWAERRAAQAGVELWSPSVGSECDTALLPLRLRGSDCLLAGGSGSGTLRAFCPSLGELDDASDDSPGPPRLVQCDEVGRRSVVASICAAGAADAASPRARVLVAWLGGEKPGVVALTELRRGRRSGRLSLRERAVHVATRESVFCAAAPARGASTHAVAGLSSCSVRLDQATMRACEPLLPAPGSDVLAVAVPPDGDAVTGLCGLRNGAIVAADSRSPSDAGVLTRLRSSVASLSYCAAGGPHALACGADGSLGAYDVRKPSPRPLLVFTGHVNPNASPRLRHAVDPEHGLIAVPGGDGCVRIWSPAQAAPLVAVTPPLPGVAFTVAVFRSAGLEGEAPRLWLGAHEGLAAVAPGTQGSRWRMMERWELGAD